MARRKRRKPVESPPPKSKPSVLVQLRLPAALAVASAVLFGLAFPPAGLWPLAFVALVPLTVALRGPRRPAAKILGAWVGGFVFFLLAVSWVRHADPKAWLGWVALAFYLSAYWPAFAWIARRSIEKVGLPAVLVVPVVWTGLEVVRDYFLTGFAWYFLGHPLYRAPVLIQVAELGGVYAVSFVVAAVNGLLADLWHIARTPDVTQRRRLAVRQGLPWAAAVAALLAGTALYGMVRMRQTRESWTLGPRVAVIQENIPQRVKHDEDKRKEVFAKHARLTLQVAKHDRPDLIVWPETMCTYPWYTVHNEPPPERWTQKYAEARKEMDEAPTRLRQLHRHVEILNGDATTALLIGIPRVVYDLGGTKLKANRYNAALYLTDPNAKPQWYHKIHLVPFGEYLPLGEVFPWLLALTPYREGYSIDSGDRYRRFELDGTRFGVIICYESSVARVTRRFVAPTEGEKGAAFLLNISNDGWFKGSSELEMHLAQNVFRAVENRVTIFRAVNTGISACILPDGITLKRVTDKGGQDRQVSGHLTEAVRADPTVTLYSRLGDVWGAANALAMLGFVGFSFVPSSKRA